MNRIVQFGVSAVAAAAIGIGAGWAGSSAARCAARIVADRH